jgi:hypothetical protein
MKFWTAYWAARVASGFIRLGRSLNEEGFCAGLEQNFKNAARKAQRN